MAGPLASLDAAASGLITLSWADLSGNVGITSGSDPVIFPNAISLGINSNLPAATLRSGAELLTVVDSYGLLLSCQLGPSGPSSDPAPFAAFPVADTASSATLIAGAGIRLAARFNSEAELQYVGF